MKNKRMTCLAILAVILLLFIAGCSQSGPTGKVVAHNTPMKIGVIAPLTGEAASYGLAAKEGLDFAVDEINAQGGILDRKIQLVYEDSQVDPKQAVSIMNKFINVDKFDIVIVADGSGPTTAVAPIADMTKTLVIGTLASTPQLSTMGDYIFRTVPSDAYQGSELADFANRQGFATAAILYANDPYGVGIRDVFTRDFSGTVVAAEAFENGDNDFRTQLTKIKQKNPDMLLLIVRNELPNVLTQAKTLRIDSVMLGSETTKNQELIEVAGSSAEGFYSIFFSEPTDYKQYRTKFETKYGREPAPYSDYSYDAVYVLKEAATKAKSFDSTKIKDLLYTTKIYGATGVVQFDSNGDVIDKPFTLYQVVGGQFVAVPS